MLKAMLSLHIVLQASWWLFVKCWGLCWNRQALSWGYSNCWGHGCCSWNEECSYCSCTRGVPTPMEKPPIAGLKSPFVSWCIQKALWPRWRVWVWRGRPGWDPTPLPMMLALNRQPGLHFDHSQNEATGNIPILTNCRDHGTELH